MHQLRCRMPLLFAPATVAWLAAATPEMQVSSTPDFLSYRAEPGWKF